MRKELFRTSGRTFVPLFLSLSRHISLPAPVTIPRVALATLLAGGFRSSSRFLTSASRARVLVIRELFASADGLFRADGYSRRLMVAGKIGGANLTSAGASSDVVSSCRSTGAYVYLSLRAQRRRSHARTHAHTLRAFFRRRDIIARTRAFETMGGLVDKPSASLTRPRGRRFRRRHRVVNIFHRPGEPSGDAALQLVSTARRRRVVGSRFTEDRRRRPRELRLGGTRHTPRIGGSSAPGEGILRSVTYRAGGRSITTSFDAFLSKDDITFFFRLILYHVEHRL